MADPHAVSLRAATKTVNELGALFDQLGNADAPRGRVLVAYRAARAALAGNLANRAAVEDALHTLRMAISEAARTVLREAGDLGAAQAEKELEALGLPSPMGAGIAGESAALSAILAVLDGQIMAIRGASLVGLDEAMVIGDDERMGLLLPGLVLQEAGRWTAAASVGGYGAAITSSVSRAGAQEDFMRQAVAAIDQKTTDCCLRVNGQVVGMNEDFHLTGTPRYADYMRQPPFHWWCRTAVALVPRDLTNDPLTQEMRAAGQAELEARAAAEARVNEYRQRLTDLNARPDVRIRADDTEQVKALRQQLRYWRGQVRVEIHPAHARSGRG